MARPVPRAGMTRIKAHMIGADPAERTPPSILVNSNESAYGPSPHACAAARAAMTGIERYVEMPDRLLAPAIAARFGLDERHIVTGQGSDDLLARAARIFLSPGDELIRTANGYLKVPNYAQANDAMPVSVPDADFVPSVDAILSAVTDRTRIVYLANPENPAGTWLDGADIRRLHAALPGHVLMILDCAYAEYVDAEDYEIGHRLVEEARNVIVARTFSKIFGLAGARVGWVHGPAEIVDLLRRAGLTFPVATPSIHAALAALEDRAHIDMVFAANRTERRKLAAKLSAMGLTVVPSQTNFLLAGLTDPERTAEAAEHYLRGRGILVRRLAAAAFRDHIRITLGLPHENDALASAIGDFLSGAG